MIFFFPCHAGLFSVYALLLFRSLEYALFEPIHKISWRKGGFDPINHKYVNLQGKENFLPMNQRIHFNTPPSTARCYYWFIGLYYRTVLTLLYCSTRLKEVWKSVSNSRRKGKRGEGEAEAKFCTEEWEKKQIKCVSEERLDQG